MIKKELNIDGVIKIYKDYYTNNSIILNNINPSFIYIICNDIYKLLLDEFYIYIIDDVVCKLQYSKIMTNSMYLNKKYGKKWLDNINYIEFEKLYPNIILKLIKNKIFILNIKEFEFIFEFLVNNIKNMKNKCENDIYLLYNLTINFFYAIISNNIHNDLLLKIKTSNEYNIVDNINSYMHNFWKKIIEDDNIIYINIDSFYYKNEDDNIIKMIIELDLPFIKQKCDGIILSKLNHYFIYDNNKISDKIIIKKNKKNIDILMLHLRKRKIEKLKEKINNKLLLN
jgi:hypothetical protein